MGPTGVFSHKRRNPSGDPEPEAGQPGRWARNPVDIIDSRRGGGYRDEEAQESPGQKRNAAKDALGLTLIGFFVVGTGGLGGWIVAQAFSWDACGDGKPETPMDGRPIEIMRTGFTTKTVTGKEHRGSPGQ